MEKELIKAQINLVVVARVKMAEAILLKALAYQKWVEANLSLFEDENNARAACQEAEAKLRELAVASYIETGEKAVAPGIGIRVMTCLTYDGQDALDWAMEHKLALKLDSPTFEKIAKTSKLLFVNIAEEPQATIATELNRVE